MTKTLVALAALAALVAPASAQVTSPRESSQIVSPTFQGNAPVDATVTRSIQNDSRFSAPASAPVNNDLQRGNQGDTFGAQSR